MTVNGAFASQSYGPATCVDNNQQVLYVIGGDMSGGDTAGTSTVQFSVDLGQSLISRLRCTHHRTRWHATYRTASHSLAH